jgi:cyclophilin family peptidyl-prolyl cis-trans isomerase
MRLARSGFYDGVPVDEVAAGHVVHAGDPRARGQGGPGYRIRDELSPLPYLRGTVGMTLEGADTGASRFFITTSPQPRLDGRYPVLGAVIAGMDVVDRLQRGDVVRSVRVWDGRTPFRESVPRDDAAVAAR